MFGAAALLNINERIAEDIGRLADTNKRVMISSIFRESPAPGEKAAVADSESLLEAEAGGSAAEKAADDVLLSEKSLNAAERLAAADKAAEVLTEERTAEGSGKAEKAAENAENINSADAVPQTLAISSFTTDLNPVYPRYAKKNNYEGVVRVSLTVNRSGRGENIKVLKSSGYSVLDKAAVKAVKKAVFKAKNSRVYYLSAALNKPLIVDINFSLT